MIDVHAHFIPQSVLQWLKDHPDKVNARWETRDPKRGEFLVIEGKWAFELKEAFSDEDGFPWPRRPRASSTLFCPRFPSFSYTINIRV